MRLIPCPGGTLVEAKYNLTPKTSFIYPQIVMYELTRIVLKQSLHPQSTVVCKRRCATQVAVWMQQIVTKYFEDPHWYSPNSSKKRVTFSMALVPQLQLWFLIVWCTYRTQGACIFKCLRIYASCRTKTLPYILFKSALPSHRHSGTPPLTVIGDMCKSQSPFCSTSQIFQLRPFS